MAIEVPRITYTKSRLAIPDDWKTLSVEGLGNYKTDRTLGFVPPHAAPLHTPARELTADEIFSDEARSNPVGLVYDVARKLLQVYNEEQALGRRSYGYAANQLGHGIRLVLMQLGAQEPQRIFANPVAEAAGPPLSFSQGCYSFAEIGGTVAAPSKVVLHGTEISLPAAPVSAKEPLYQARNIKPLELAGPNGFYARLADHEVNIHLEGDTHAGRAHRQGNDVTFVPHNHLEIHGLYIRGQDAGDYAPQLFPIDELNALLAGEFTFDQLYIPPDTVI